VALHRHLGDFLGKQPVPQSMQIRGEGAELTHLLSTPATWPWRAHTGHHRVFVHIQPGAAGHHDLHRAPPGHWGEPPEEPDDIENLTSVLVATIQGA
jgi:hypothetical protein